MEVRDVVLNDSLRLHFLKGLLQRHPSLHLPSSPQSALPSLSISSDGILGCKPTVSRERGWIEGCGAGLRWRRPERWKWAPEDKAYHVPLIPKTSSWSSDHHMAFVPARAASHSHSTENRRRFQLPKTPPYPNPAALSTCRTSRDVALERYRLVFGTHMVYGDLPGGDMLYFVPWCECLRPRLGRPRLRNFSLVSKPGMKDLEEVTHLVIRMPPLRDDTGSDSVRTLDVSIYRLRRCLEAPKSVKKISLVLGGTDQPATCKYPGQSVWEFIYPLRRLNHKQNMRKSETFQWNITTQEKPNIDFKII
jgi:hypothetical protein